MDHLHVLCALLCLARFTFCNNYFRPRNNTYNRGVIELTKEKKVELRASFNPRPCHVLSQNPSLEINELVGLPWRVYHTWGWDLRQKCIDITFKRSTKRIEGRFQMEMQDKLEVEPDWQNAVLHVTMGSPDHEMLLFSDYDGPQGRYIGVYNLNAGSLTPKSKSVPLMIFQIKLLSNNQLLAFTDCVIGVTSLSVRSDEVVLRDDIDSLAKELNLGRGAPACMRNQNLQQQPVFPEGLINRI